MADSTYFDESYFNAPMPDAGGARIGDDNGAYFEAANFAEAVLDLQELAFGTVLVVGCGRGWTVRHLRNKGIPTEGCDFSAYALKNSVCGAVFGDITKRLPFEDRSFDLVVCNGLLSYLPADQVTHAIEELYRVSRSTLWTSTLVSVAPWAEHGHSTVMPVDVWVEFFMSVGWVPIEFEGLIESFGYDASPYQWHQVWEKLDRGGGYGLSISIKTTRDLQCSAARRRLALNIARFNYYERLYKKQRRRQ